MIDFSTEEKIRNKLKGYKPDSMGLIGEAVVALQFHDIFKDKIDRIDKLGNDVDLTIKFKDEEKPITVEVKSSAFKDAYFRDYWVYGVPIKTKDFGYNFDLLAMVNFIPPDKNNSLGNNSKKIRSDHKNVTLYFMYNELDSLLPNPFMYIPTTTLIKLREESRNSLKYFLASFNNYYKGVIVDPTIIFDEIGFSWDNYKLNNNLKGKLGFPSWFNKSLSCKYLANYAVNRREFYERKITSKWKERIDLRQMVENAIINEPKKLKINEEYPIDSNFCKNCVQKCKYITIKR
ncbi:hypothetical protein ES708_16807 [subsurface metagenome]